MSDWKRWGSETIVIVLGILLALFIDAAWEYRGERVQEREYLEAVRSELSVSARELAADQEARARILARASALPRGGGG